MEDCDVSQDAFLGGRLKIWQPKQGYRAGSDAVLLASAVRAAPGQTVLELGCGVGVASLCLGARVGPLALTGIELQPDYATLARRNAASNNIEMTVVEADIAALPADLRQQSFHHVLANPPYFEAERQSEPRDQGKSVAHIGKPGSIAAWVEIGVKRLAPKGLISLIHLSESLPDVLGALSQGCGEIEVHPIASRARRPAGRVITIARKGANAPMVLHPPKIMHKFDEHQSDVGDFSDWASAIMRDAQPFG